jgi:hypothetical protein
VVNDLDALGHVQYGIVDCAVSSWTVSSCGCAEISWVLVAHAHLCLAASYSGAGNTAVELYQGKGESPDGETSGREWHNNQPIMLGRLYHIKGIRIRPAFLLINNSLRPHSLLYPSAFSSLFTSRAGSLHTLFHRLYPTHSSSKRI